MRLTIHDRFYGSHEAISLKDDGTFIISRGAGQTASRLITGEYVIDKNRIKFKNIALRTILSRRIIDTRSDREIEFEHKSEKSLCPDPWAGKTFDKQLFSYYTGIYIFPEPLYDFLCARDPAEPKNYQPHESKKTYFRCDDMLTGKDVITKNLDFDYYDNSYCFYHIKEQFKDITSLDEIDETYKIKNSWDIAMRKKIIKFVNDPDMIVSIDTKQVHAVFDKRHNIVGIFIDKTYIKYVPEYKDTVKFLRKIIFNL